MRKMIMAVMMIALLCLSIPAQADRLADIGAKYESLKAEKARIEKDLLRLEGMFQERQMAVKEAAEAIVPEEPAAEVAEPITETE